MVGPRRCTDFRTASFLPFAVGVAADGDLLGRGASFLPFAVGVAANGDLLAP
jgi:hypothetical protein